VTYDWLGPCRLDAGSVFCSVRFLKHAGHSSNGLLFGKPVACSGTFIGSCRTSIQSNPKRILSKLSGITAFC
jgi:hypothetical protein